MERIDLFDRYIYNELGVAEKAELEARLKSDDSLASDFTAYLLTVRGIRREVEQDDIDFGVAMKRISRAQLREVMGLTAETPLRACAEPNIVRPGRWRWRVAAVAAVVVIAFTVSFNLIHHERAITDNALAMGIELYPSRGGGLDIANMTDKELMTNRADIRAAFDNSSTDADFIEYGEALVRADLLAHDREEAREALQRLIDRFRGNDEYAGYVDRWTRMLELLK